MHILIKKLKLNMIQETTIDEGVQADVPEPTDEEPTLKIRPLERIKLHPKVPVEPSAYGKGKNFSRPWILQDGREPPGKGSEMRDKYKIPKKPRRSEELCSDDLIAAFVNLQGWDGARVILCSAYLPGDKEDPTEDLQRVAAYARKHNAELLVGCDANAHHTTWGSSDINARGIRKKMLTDFFWEQMLEEVIDELSANQPQTEHCSEYEANYVKENFEPRNLEITANRDMHLKYPLYGTGSSAITFYSETIKKTGPGEILEKFRRCQYFTRPMEERLDDGWVL